MRISLTKSETTINEIIETIHVEFDRNDLSELIKGNDINITAYQSIKKNPEEATNKIVYNFNLASR